MLDPDERLAITYSGEIYNYQELRADLSDRGHKFFSTSDTEVIIAAYRQWGTGCLERLNGMFSFGLFDVDRKLLFLARDRAGQKPLYYYKTEGELAFASEVKAILMNPAVPREIDLVSLDEYIAYGCVHGHRCIFKGFQKLPQGHAMTYEVERDRLAVWQYWRLPEFCSRPNETLEDLSREAEALLRDAVKKQLVADVPVGVMLSGGMDSSLVTAMASQVSSRPVRTYTVSFPGHQLFDEGPYAKLIADHYGTEHTQLVAEPTAIEILPQLSRQFDEPIADHSILPTALVSRLIGQSLKVALSGDGGDETFGGYWHYSYVQLINRILKIMPVSLRRLLSSAAQKYLVIGARGRNHLIGLGGDLASGIAHINIYFTQAGRRRLLSPLVDRYRELEFKAEQVKTDRCARGSSPLQQATRVDFQTTMVDGYLVKVDRASMLYSLEVRSPFLDHRLVELAFGRIPDRFRATINHRKVLLRSIAKRVLPPTFDLDRKQGFTLPLERWFLGEWGRFFEDFLGEASTQIFDQRVIQELLSEQRKGHSNSNRLFALAMFELWRREYRATLPVA